MKSMTQLIRRCTDAIVGSWHNRVDQVLDGWDQSVSTRSHDAGWLLRESVGDQHACMKLVASMDKQARKNGKRIGTTRYWLAEAGASKESAALFSALGRAGEDECRVESMAKAYSAPCGLPELCARLCVLNSALAKHRDYYVALSVAPLRVNGIPTPIPSCYVEKDAVVSMAGKVACVVGGAWLMGWGRCWRELEGSVERAELAYLASLLLDQVEARPMPEATERVWTLLSGLGKEAVESLIEASLMAEKSKSLKSARSVLIARSERFDIKAALHESDSFEPKARSPRL